MEKPTKEQIEPWIKEHNWLLMKEEAMTTPITGKQLTYLTPSGQDVVIIYDLKGELFGIGHMVQVPQPIPGPGLGGFPGKQFGIGHG